MGETDELRIFYSWQSDSPEETNLNAIRAALKSAAKKITAARPEIKVVRDEATRDTSGSPNIVSKILEKVEIADVFVADVTTITPAGAKRPCPNPNVGYELGYAVAHLGWDRIIVLFNRALGEFPTDLPFDFAQHRASPYTMAKSDPAALGKLAEFLVTAITAVIEKNPKRPAELRGVPRVKLEHDHDVRNMAWLMSKIHLPTMDDHIDDLPYRISARALWFHEHLVGVVANSLFSVYDPVLKSAVDRLYVNWHAALSHDEQYRDTPGGQVHVFDNPMDLPLPRHRKEVWDQIETARTEMRKALDGILARLREGYIEVDIYETNAKAWKDYVSFQEETKKAFGEKPESPARKKKKK